MDGYNFARSALMAARGDGDPLPLSQQYLNSHDSSQHSLIVCRGYLAKGAVYKSQGRKSDAQRSFIQARYLAPANLKPLVEKLSAM